jgi:hypothetical protein
MIRLVRVWCLNGTNANVVTESGYNYQYLYGYQRYCPDKRKKKAKPKNDKLSFSKGAEDRSHGKQIAATQQGKSVIINETSIDIETYHISSDGINLYNLVEFHSITS